jgi:hypothetical protein
VLRERIANRIVNMAATVSGRNPEVCGELLSMRRTPAVLLSLVAASLLAHPAGAATAPGLHVPDLVGDANGVNSQGLELPLPATSTPANVKGLDIAGFDVVNLYKGKGKTRKPAGFTFRLRFAGPLQDGVNVTVTMDTSAPCGESSTIQLGYQKTPALTNALAICQSADPSGSSTTVGATEVAADGMSITWTMDKVLPARTQITSFSASTSVFVLGVFDDLNSDRTFVYGV